MNDEANIIHSDAKWRQIVRLEKITALRFKANYGFMIEKSKKVDGEESNEPSRSYPLTTSRDLGWQWTEDTANLEIFGSLARGQGDVLRCGNSFDTYKFIQRLEQADGFSREGAEGIMQSLAEVVQESSINLAKSSVTKADFERALYQKRVDLGNLRSEVSALEKNEFGMMKAEIARLSNEATKLPSRVSEESRRIQSNFRLELSLDKARTREDQTNQELKIKEVMSRIDSDLALFKTQMEVIQWELFRTLFPLFCAGGALFFSAMRLMQ